MLLMIVYSQTHRKKSLRTCPRVFPLVFPPQNRLGVERQRSGAKYRNWISPEITRIAVTRGGSSGLLGAASGVQKKKEKEKIVKATPWILRGLDMDFILSLIACRTSLGKLAFATKKEDLNFLLERAYVRSWNKRYIPRILFSIVLVATSSRGRASTCCTDRRR